MAVHQLFLYTLWDTRRAFASSWLVAILPSKGEVVAYRSELLANEFLGSTIVPEKSIVALQKFVNRFKRVGFARQRIDEAVTRRSGKPNSFHSLRCGKRV